MENIKQDDAKEKIEVEGSGGWEELNDPVVKAIESEFKGKPEEEFSAQGKSKNFFGILYVCHYNPYYTPGPCLMWIFGLGKSCTKWISH